MSVKNGGFSLIEMLIALALSGILMLGAMRLLPLLQQQTLRLQSQVWLRETLQQMVNVLEKAIRRAGYCHGDCQGEALHWQTHCLLVRWDENSNGRWEGPEREESEWYGYRLREGRLEMQRGVSSCSGGGWESLTDPRIITIDALQIERHQRQFILTLSGYAPAFPTQPVTLTTLINVRNMP